jgi:uncharacterized protein YjbI with pentapeptide repeats
VHILLTITHKYLQADCENCFGLCCVALPFAASTDFALNKNGGVPCPNLNSNFRCGIHSKLRETGFKGCTVFECFGAGQKVSQHTFNGISWQENPEQAKKMYDVFPIVQQLHEMLSYLTEALALEATRSIHQELRLALDATEQLSNLDAKALLEIHIPLHRTKVNELLLQTSELVWRASRPKGKRLNHRRANFIGAKLKKANLSGADLRGACLIAANLQDADLRSADFIGADLRDANLRGANLTGSIFLTQVQINAAKGDMRTVLPDSLIQPTHWKTGE